MVPRVTIVGGGFSGVLTAMQLCRTADPPQVYLVERAARPGPGHAYRTEATEHLLNVPAGNMGAFPDDPEHFIRFLRRGVPAAGPADFVPRRLYGDYLAAIVCEGPRDLLTVVRASATEVTRDASGQRHSVYLHDGRVLGSEAVVFAFGHGGARVPAWSGAATTGAAYVQDPWQPDALDHVASAGRVLLLGTGLTALDVSLTVSRRNAGVRIEAWSRHGLVPLPHRAPAARPPPVAIVPVLLSGPSSVRRYLREIRMAAYAAVHRGADWRDVVAALRPGTPELWQRLGAAERSRFLRHLRTYWEAHRHRCSPAAYDQLRALMQDGRIEFHAGRLESARVKAAHGW